MPVLREYFKISSKRTGPYPSPSQFLMICPLAAKAPLSLYTVSNFHLPAARAADAMIGLNVEPGSYKLVTAIFLKASSPLWL